MRASIILNYFQFRLLYLRTCAHIIRRYEYGTCSESSLEPKPSGGKLHKLVRSKFPPKSHPDYYIAPEKTAARLERKSKSRTAKKRPRLTRSEKELLAHDLTLKEVELTDGKQELQNLSREITLATQPIRAIMRDAELCAMMPPETRMELERFAEIYV